MATPLPESPDKEDVLIDNYRQYIENVGGDPDPSQDDFTKSFFLGEAEIRALLAVKGAKGIRIFLGWDKRKGQGSGARKIPFGKRIRLIYKPSKGAGVLSTEPTEIEDNSKDQNEVKKYSSSNESIPLTLGTLKVIPRKQECPPCCNVDDN